MDDEAQAQRTAVAILKALSKIPRQSAKPMEAEEKPIDTTDPDFVKNFQGFVVGDPPAQRRVNRQTSTEIKRG